MRAIVHDAYGSPDVLKLREIDTPAVGDCDVLVRVHAAGLNMGVWHLMTGQPYRMRIMGAGLLKSRKRVAGTDVAGRVEAVGKDVTQFRRGDEVFGTCNGAFAEYACTREDAFVGKPANLTFEQAAAVPDSAVTALEGIVKLTKTRLIDPQDDGLEPVVNRVCRGAVSPSSLNLTIPVAPLVADRATFRAPAPRPRRVHRPLPRPSTAG